MWLVTFAGSALGQIPPNYYDAAAGSSGAALKRALHEIIDDHQAHTYSEAEGFVKDLDGDPSDPSSVILIYSRDSVSKSSWPGFNREHVWPQSMGALRHPAKSDMHHIFAADQNVNSARGNKPYDRCTENCRTHVEAPRAPYNSNVWEPPDEDKGDIARALLYMAVRYEGDGGEPDLELTNDDPTTGCDCMGHLNTLLAWHVRDPVDDRERRRNDRIFNDIQGNRNPFIDRPEWVGRIWGGPAGSGTTPGPVPVPIAGEARVRLRATHHEGVPIHSQAKSTPNFQRVPDGMVVVVIDRTADGGWLHIRLPDGRTGWIVRKYVDGPADGGPTPPPPTTVVGEREADVWESAATCQAAMNAGARMQRTDPTAVRVATWNVRWFPRGCSFSEDCSENATDLDWFACAIAWMDVDILALQEITSTADATSSFQRVINTLNSVTGGSWDLDLQDCGGSAAQRVGFLWNRSRVTLSSGGDVWEMNGAAQGVGGECANNLRPGRYAQVTSPGGVDFHVVAVHLDSGTTSNDYDHRRIALGRLSAIERNGQALVSTDRDVVILGDFNTMGRGATPSIPGEAEVAALAVEVAPDFRRVLPEFACSEYYQGHGGSIDHLLVTTAMVEAPSAARLTGYCAVHRCEAIPGAMPAAYETLSDHCPQVIDIRPDDLD